MADGASFRPRPANVRRGAAARTAALSVATLTLLLLVPGPQVLPGPGVAVHREMPLAPAAPTALERTTQDAAGNAVRSSSAPTTAAQWPMYLHDLQRTGGNLEERTVGPANASALGLLWSFNTTGGITGSAAVVNGTVFFGAWDGRLYAVSATNGSLLWKTSLGGSKDWTGCGLPGIAATPVVWNDTVYVGGGNPWMYALNASTGSILWHVDLANVSGSSTPWTAHKIWSSGVVYHGSLYVGIASGCDAPLVRGALVQITLSDHTVAHVFWTLPAAQVGPGIWSSPSIDPGTNTVWVTTGNEYLSDTKYARAVVGLNASNVSEVVGYAQEAQPFLDLDFGDGATLFESSSGTPMVVAVNKNGYAYAFNESGLHANGSSPTVWTRLVENSGGWSYAPPAFDGHTLYFGTVATMFPNGTGTLGSVQAVDPDNGHLRWETAVPSAVYAGATYADGLVVVGLTGGGLLVLNATNGDILRNQPTGYIWGEPIVVDGEVLCTSGSESSSLGGNIEAFGFTLSAAAQAVRVSTGANDTFRMTAEVHGGVTPYNLTWDLGDGTRAYGGVVTHDYATAGVVDGSLTVVDARSVRVVAPFQVHAYLPLTGVPAFSVDPVNLGGSTLVSVNVSGGAAPIQYLWGPLPPGAPPVDTSTSSFLFVPSLVGNYSIDVQVLASTGQSINVTFPRLWVDGPLSYTILASPSSGPLPLTVRFQASSGYTGVAGAFRWDFGDGGTSTLVAPTHTYTSPGRFPVTVLITYPGGSRASASTSVPAFAPLSILGPGQKATDVGTRVDLEADPTGGAGAYSWAWSGLPNGCVNQNASVLACVPSVAGAFPITVTVRDPLGGSLESYGSLLVAPRLSLPPVVPSVINGSCGAAAPRASVDLQAIPVGGTAPVTVVWEWSGGVRNATEIRVLLDAPSTTEFTVTARDNVSVSVTQVLNVTTSVDPCPAGSSAPFWTDPSVLGLGGLVALAAAGVAVVLLRRRGRR